MVFKCQEDSFLKEFETCVTKIEKTGDKLLVNFEVCASLNNFVDQSRLGNRFRTQFCSPKAAVSQLIMARSC